MSIVEFSEKLELPKSTVYRFLMYLKKRGYIEKTANNKYELGIKCLYLGLNVMQGMEITLKAKDVMNELTQSTGFTAHLAIQDGNYALYIEKVESSKTSIVHSRIGKRTPMHCTAVGLVLLSAFSEEEFYDYCRQTTFTPLTIHTITEPQKLSDYLEISPRICH